MRSHYCAEINEENNTQPVELCGWVNRRRDHGGVIFLDVRDRTGLVQVVFEPENQATFQIAETIRNEFIIHMTGTVRPRPAGQENPNLKTGNIEVLGQTLTILSEAQTPPFQIEGHQTVSEEVRLTYRYIDLRRDELQQRLIMRSKMNHLIHQFMDEQGYLNLETPILTRATPEGARDYLVPSRTQPGHFFALPQSPQLFKQLFMMSGFDKYYQIVRCFRDEDLRADRQPEFTQLDIEASFVNEEDIYALTEGLLQHIFKTLLNVDLPEKFPRMSYHDAMRDYASDKPDLRNPLKLVDIADLVTNVDFQVFAKPAADKHSRVVVLKAPQATDKLSRKMLDDYGKYVGIYGAKGLAYIKVNDRAAGSAGLQSPILKFLPEETIQAILDRLAAENGDILFFGADHNDIVNPAMGALRNKIGTDLNLIAAGFAPLWVTEFPMFEKAAHGPSAVHHPFTRPKVASAAALKSADVYEMLSHSYDIVMNGYELGGGSLRIFDRDMQAAVLEILKLDAQAAHEKFGFFLDALQYGVPPHGGIAFGMDRLAMILAGTDHIRDVIAFPKTQNASCLMTKAPSAVEFNQLHELGIRINAPETANAD